MVINLQPRCLASGFGCNNLMLRRYHKDKTTEMSLGFRQHEWESSSWDPAGIIFFFWWHGRRRCSQQRRIFANWGIYESQFKAVLSYSLVSWSNSAQPHHERNENLKPPLLFDRRLYCGVTSPVHARCRWVLRTAKPRLSHPWEHMTWCPRPTGRWYSQVAAPQNWALSGTPALPWLHDVG